MMIKISSFDVSNILQNIQNNFQDHHYHHHHFKINFHFEMNIYDIMQRKQW